MAADCILANGGVIYEDFSPFLLNFPEIFSKFVHEEK